MSPPAAGNRHGVLERKCTLKLQLKLQTVKEAADGEAGIEIYLRKEEQEHCRAK